MTDNLVTWLRAQLDEDERVARRTIGGPWHVEDDCVLSGRLVVVEGIAVDHIARHDPARVLAEVDAKRRLLDDHARPDDQATIAQHYCEADGWCRDPRDSDLREPRPCQYVRILALPYAARPGYRDEWRP